jgi:hypothetical protein
VYKECTVINLIPLCDWVSKLSSVLHAGSDVVHQNRGNTDICLELTTFSNGACNCCGTAVANERDFMVKCISVRFKVLMAVMILVMFFWVKVPCGLVSRSQCFREVGCLHL